MGGRESTHARVDGDSEIARKKDRGPVINLYDNQ